MSFEPAIRVEDLSKCYHIYNRPLDRLRQAVLPKIQRYLTIEEKRYYNEFWALKNISFDLTRGCSLGILGLNGAGKSTLLQIICGTLTPSSGGISINGRIAALLELGAGFNPEFTGIENIHLNATILGLSKRDIDLRLDDILSFADIGDFIDQPVKTYSSGMYVRLAFSIAVHSSPDILVIDEALSVGDFRFQQKCNTFMKEELSSVTKLFVSHDISAVANLTNRALVLKRGELIFYGDSKLAIQAYQRSSREAEETHRSTSNRRRYINGAPTEDMPGKANDVIQSNWLPVSPASLSGTLETTIKRYAWAIEEEPSCCIARPGDRVLLSVLLDCQKTIEAPVVGYQIQNRFGVVVFGGNSISSDLDVPALIEAQLALNITIVWPEVADGKYSITIGVGSGSDSEKHEVICWAHNLIVVDSIATRAVHGIFNNPITALDFTQQDA
jgi:ABC-type polysaccharide/polyol phosphate transport system ATPase subunit